jgi:type IV pilus assembly protein PilY1
LREGEQVVARALTLADKVHFNTYRDSAAPLASCGKNAGVASRYSLDYLRGEGAHTDVPGGFLLPTPLAGRVELDDGSVVPFCIGCGGETAVSGDMALPLPPDVSRPEGKVYWKIVK